MGVAHDVVEVSMSGRINWEAEAGFGQAADAYERGRPGYPPEAVAVLTRALRLRSGATVVDVGAGTGKLTRLLVPTGVNLVAVEPVAAMRERLLAASPGIRTLDGTAQDLPMPDGSADAIVAGQAFHWFADHDALAEFARVLRTDGRLGMVWNDRGHSALAEEITALLADHQGDTPSHRTGAWLQAFEAQSWFGPLRHRAVAHAHTLPLDAAVDRFGSISYVAAMPGAERADLLARIRVVLARVTARDGTVTLPYKTEVWWAQRRRGR